MRKKKGKKNCNKQRSTLGSLQNHCEFYNSNREHKHKREEVLFSDYISSTCALPYFPPTPLPLRKGKGKRSHLNKYLRTCLSSPSPRLNSVQYISSTLPRPNSPYFHHVLSSVPLSYFREQWEVHKADIAL